MMTRMTAPKKIAFYPFSAWFNVSHLADQFPNSSDEHRLATPATFVFKKHWGLR